MGGGKVATAIRIETEMARYYVVKAHERDPVTKAFVRHVYEVTCDCGAVERGNWSPDVSPELLRKNIGHRGWVLKAGKVPVCPACANRKETPVLNKPAPAAPSLPPLAEEPKTPNLKIMHAIFSKLDEHFDKTNRLYLHGWSDERVATETHAALPVVIKYRREVYGELAEDPKFTELKDDIALLRMEMVDTANKWGERMGSLERRMGLFEAGRVK